MDRAALESLAARTLAELTDRAQAIETLHQKVKAMDAARMPPWGIRSKPTWNSTGRCAGSQATHHTPLARQFPPLRPPSKRPFCQVGVVRYLHSSR